MKGNLLGRWLMILLIFGGSLYYLYPSYRFNQLSDEEQLKITSVAHLSGISRGEIVNNIYHDDVDLKAIISRHASAENAARANKIVDELRGKLRDGIDAVRGTSIKRGLDLQGGMYLVMEVDAVKLLENVAKAKDDAFITAMKEVAQRAAAHTDQDVIDIAKSVFQAGNIPMSRYFGQGQTDQQVIDALKKMESDAVDRSLEILRNRIDQFGVSEPSITRQGSQRIILELPGVQDPQRARGLIGKTALLEFKMLVEADRADRVLADIDRAIAGDTTKKADTGAVAQAGVTTADTNKAAGSDTLFGQKRLASGDTGKFGGLKPFTGLLRQYRETIAVDPKDVNRVNQMLGSEKVRAILPMDVQFLWGKAPDANSKNRMVSLYLVKSKAEMTGSGLTDARVQLGGQRSGSPDVNFELNNEGRRVFARVTGANIGKRMGIVLDNVVHMAPTIRSRIPDGRGVIEGSGSVDEANDLAIVLRAGSLPAPVKVMEERTVGPSLGRDSVQASTRSFIISFIVIAAFMALYYKLSGVIADIALMTNVVIAGAVLAMFQATLTVPGIAGLILSMGMSVDSNVLIYERVREEWRSGKTPAHAIKAGFDRAFITVLDSHITTVFSGLALYQFGTGPVKGFALTLMIGVGVSMYTAFYMSRAIYDLYLQKVMPKTLSI